MRKIFLLVILMLGIMATHDVSAKLPSNYGIYGEVLYPASGSPTCLIEGPTILVYKLVNGSYVYHGSTVASACGYYTYDTGGTGSYYVMIQGNYYLRDYDNCSVRVDYNWHAGSGSGSVTFLSPYTVINLRCT